MYYLLSIMMNFEIIWLFFVGIVYSNKGLFDLIK